jgi:hypothetical protein
MFIPGKIRVVESGRYSNWPPGAGSVNLNYGFVFGTGYGSFVFIQDSKKFLKKVHYFIIFNDLLPVPYGYRVPVPIRQHIFFKRHKHV